MGYTLTTPTKKSNVYYNGRLQQNSGFC